MTSVIDHNTRLVSQLISSCYKAQDGYRSAASAVKDDSLKRLFEIYAQQRIRFAEELREYLPLLGGSNSDGFAGGQLDGASRQTARPDSIRECLEIDAHNLALYKEALAHRALPTRAQFVISAQLALMERVHDRMNHMLNGHRSSAAGPVQGQRVSA